MCYINCISNDFLTKHNVSTIEEIFEQKLPLRIGCSPVGSMDAQGAYLLLEYFGVTQEDLESWGGSITNQSGSENQAALQARSTSTLTTPPPAPPPWRKLPPPAT